MRNIQELNKEEIRTVSGGNYSVGFFLAAYIDFEIGVAKGIGKAISNFF